ncbi:MAG: cytochrome b/b6 domain-containing protein [Alphaproteobacteria bacterium]|nr:cytochrome b/b6 domain-containing protein [Alphaproteobacteria bacterium]MBF0394200.1 cytochrome b/b6 domain-containing protein [Alphaproteobacteria bacterium]
MSERIYMLPFWLRAWHWVNAALILVLIVTGGSLHFAQPDLPLVPFALAARLHDIAGVALAALYGFFVIANIVSGNWWQYVPKPGGFVKRCLVQTRFYCWDIFWGRPHPYPPTLAANFNSLQQIIYWFIMYFFMPILLLTGLMFLVPEWAPQRVLGLDGLLPIAMAHTAVGLVITLFLIGHIYLGTTGLKVTSLFRMMITGWHEH